MPQFEFVTISDLREAKKHSTKVRRHVMKDIGKARRKVKTGAKETTTKRKSAADQTEQANRDIIPMRAGRRPIQVSVGHERDMSSRAARAPVISPWAESLLSQMVYPIEMNEAKLELVRFSKYTKESHDARTFQTYIEPFYFISPKQVHHIC